MSSWTHQSLMPEISKVLLFTFILDSTRHQSVSFWASNCLYFVRSRLLTLYLSVGNIIHQWLDTNLVQFREHNMNHLDIYDDLVVNIVASQQEGSVFNPLFWPGVFLCGLFMFSPWLCGFLTSSPVSFQHSKKILLDFLQASLPKAVQHGICPVK